MKAERNKIEELLVRSNRLSSNQDGIPEGMIEELLLPIENLLKTKSDMTMVLKETPE
jgi:hypothetical protein